MWRHRKNNDMSKLIVEIPDALHYELKLEALELGISLRLLVIAKLEDC